MVGVARRLLHRRLTRHLPRRSRTVVEAVIPLHLLPDTLDYIGMGEDLGNGPTELEPVRVRCRVETKTKLITYAEGRTANATDFVILAPSITPQLEAKLAGSPLWGAYGERHILSVETLRDLAGQVHHHEVWAG